ncbi:MAG TPA: GTA-gp10 family protein [Anaerolineae bacterium]|nr:GTA-gp10 family protein [Anaerolineae bacterium]
MATGARGESLIQVGEQEYHLLFTNRALASAEQRTGKSIMQLAGQAMASQLSMTDTAALLMVGLEAARLDMRVGGRSWDLSRAYEVMDQAGFVKSSLAVMEGIAAVISYDPDAKAEEGEGDDDDSPPEQ